MRYLTIAEICTLTKGEAVPATSGVLKKVGKWTDGENDNGHWSFQNCVLEDATGQIKLKLKNRVEVPPSWEGKTLQILAAKGDKKPWLGSTRDVDTYREKDQPMLLVDDRAVMQESGPATQQQPAHQAHTQTAPAPQTQASQPPPARQAPANGHGPLHDLNEAKKRICQRGNLYLLCYRMGKVNRDILKQSGEEMSDGHFQGMVASLFISVDKIGLHSSMPQKPIDL